ncbi:hypothetical protein WDW89_17485 [Deltaproteobacteria bacterium TL4]
MIVIVGVILSIVTVVIVIYPLFFQKIYQYELAERPSLDFNEVDSLLLALQDLDSDFELGSISQSDYERLKLYFQRQYLSLKRKSKSQNAS